MTHAWDSEQRARVLIARREELLARLPREFRVAGEVRADVRELIVDEAIGYVALDHRGTIATEEDLEHLFWGACILRVRRALYQHAYDTVRGGWRPASADKLDRIPGGSNPETEVVRRDERRTALEFATTLTPHEREVLACKYSGAETRGYKEISRMLGMSWLQVRRTEAAINRKLDRFATIVTAGRLCGYREPAVASLAAGLASELEQRAARAHLMHCAPCTMAYNRQLHYLRGAAFGRKVAAVLPLPPAAAASTRSGTSIRDVLVDLVTRPFGSDAASSTAQLVSSGVGRGAGAAVAAKLVALCLAGGATLGVCAVTGVLPTSPNGTHDGTESTGRARSVTKPRPSETPDRLPTRAEAHLIATPTPTPRRRVRRPNPTSTPTGSTAQGGTTSTSHERPLASPPVTGTRSSTPGGAEFNFERSSSTARPRPAPPPRAPGSREFP